MRRVITKSPPEGYAFYPSLTFEGNALYFLQQTRGRHFSADDQATQHQDEIHLMRVELRTGAKQEILSAASMESLSVFADGTHVVYSARRGDKRSHLWLLPTDHHSPPQQISPDDTDDDEAISLNNGDIVFRRQENNAFFVYRMRPDGSGLRKLLPTPIVHLGSVSPDGGWLTATVNLSDGSDFFTQVYRLPDGTATRLCKPCRTSFSPDGKYLYLSFNIIATSSSTQHGQTHALARKAGSYVQSLPPGGTLFEADVAKVATLVPAATQAEDFASGPSPNVYGFSRRAVGDGEAFNFYPCALPVIGQLQSVIGSDSAHMTTLRTQQTISRG